MQAEVRVIAESGEGAFLYVAAGLTLLKCFHSFFRKSCHIPVGMFVTNPLFIRTSTKALSSVIQSLEEELQRVTSDPPPRSGLITSLSANSVRLLTSAYQTDIPSALHMIRQLGRLLGGIYPSVFAWVRLVLSRKPFLTVFYERIRYPPIGMCASSSLLMF